MGGCVNSVPKKLHIMKKIILFFAFPSLIGSMQGQGKLTVYPNNDGDTITVYERGFEIKNPPQYTREMEEERIAKLGLSAEKLEISAISYVEVMPIYSLAEAVKSIRSDFAINTDFWREQNCFDSLPPYEPSKVEMAIVILGEYEFKFGPLETKIILKKMDQMGFRPAKPSELLGLAVEIKKSGKQISEDDRFGIIALPQLNDNGTLNYCFYDSSINNKKDGFSYYRALSIIFRMPGIINGRDYNSIYLVPFAEYAVCGSCMFAFVRR